MALWISLTSKYAEMHGDRNIIKLNFNRRTIDIDKEFGMLGWHGIRLKFYTRNVANNLWLSRNCKEKSEKNQIKNTPPKCNQNLPIISYLVAIRCFDAWLWTLCVHFRWEWLIFRFIDRYVVAWTRTMLPK